MAFPTRATHAVQAEINMIPLIDVMLVLLIVFMVTAPLMTHSVRIELPRTVAPDTSQPADALRIGFDSTGQLSLNGQDIDETGLARKFAEAASISNPPAIHLYADQQTPYGPIARVMAQAARAGLSRIGFESTGMPDNPRPAGNQNPV